jgi:hypothetical protein
LWWADTDIEEGGGRLYVYTGDEWVDVSLPGNGFSGEYNDLEGKPNLDDYLSSVNNDTAEGEITFEENAYFEKNVGIGTDSPSTKLDVNGDVSIGLANADSLATDANGKIIAGSIDLSGYVTLDTEQNVTGKKSFTDASVAKPADFWSSTPSFFVADTGSLTSQGSHCIHITAGGYRNKSGTWTATAPGGTTGAAQVLVNPNGEISFNAETNKASGTGTGVAQLAYINPTAAIFNVPITGTASNASKLNNLGSDQFLRSDAADQKTSGTLRMNTNVALTFGNSENAKLSSNNNHFYLDLLASAGNFYIREGTTTRYTFNKNGNFTATGNVTAYSDISLKENIETIPNALDKVLALRGVGYNRIDLEEKSRQIGVIAQEIEEVIPEVVITGEEGIKSVAYGNLVALLIESVKELKAEVNELKAKLED